jgi:hypothetical protein
MSQFDEKNQTAKSPRAPRIEMEEKAAAGKSRRIREA